MHRRDFLHPRRLAITAGQFLAVMEQPARPAPVAPSPEVALLRFGRRAMATAFEIAIPLGTNNAAPAAEAALDLLDPLESQLTIYRDTSEISRINRFAPLGPLPVEPRLWQLLDLASRIHRETAGAYDIAIGALIKAWGFSRRQARVPSEPERASALSQSGMSHVILNADHRTIHFTPPGIELNLGSIGKGYALDRMGETLRDNASIHSALLHGGSSSVLALGTQPGQPRGWPIGLGHPQNLDRRLGIVWLRNRALGTSSATFQHLSHHGRQLGHILDPRSAWPADELASATAIAPTAAEADALATAFFVMGVEPSRVYCQKHPDVGAVLLPPGQSAPITIGNVDFA